MFKGLLPALLMLPVTAGLLWGTTPKHKLELIVCSVGQGDAILLKTGFTQVLVDAGPPAGTADLLSCLEKYMPFGDRTLELIVSTHPDADHIGGFPQVLKSYSVQAHLKTGMTSDSQLFAEFTQALEEEEAISGLFGVCAQPLGHISLGQGTRLWMVYPECLLLENGQPDLETNDSSQVILLEVGEVSALLTGDIGEKVEQALLSQGLIISTQILKVAHHGSKTSTSLGFIDKLQPEMALISAGAKNQYGHPDATITSRLLDSGATILRTDLTGTIHLTSNGQQWSIVSP